MGKGHAKSCDLVFFIYVHCFHSDSLFFVPVVSRFDLTWNISAINIKKMGFSFLGSFIGWMMGKSMIHGEKNDLVVQTLRCNHDCLAARRSVPSLDYLHSSCLRRVASYSVAHTRHFATILGVIGKCSYLWFPMGVVPT